MAAVVVGLHVVGFGIQFLIVGTDGYSTGTGHTALGLGVGLLAYTLGMRHAFDADHIAAIDNTTRRLLGDRSSDRQPLSVGFWFSLGHSSVVFAMTLALALGVRLLVGPLQDDTSSLQFIAGTIGPTVAGTFLWILALLNLVGLIGIVKTFRTMRQGPYDEAELERQLESRGAMNRVLGRLTRSVRKPWHIYPIGVLFGLGLDTATEVALLVLAGGAAAMALPFYAILMLPVLFAAGMVLMDTVDGIFMNAAYGWAFAKPVRKVFYNVVITSISVAVALVIGTVALVGVLVDRLHIESGPLRTIADTNLDYYGYGIVGLFVLTWLVAISVWKFGRIEQRWSGA
jgi:high-affinity nickel-transport protein